MKTAKILQTLLFLTLSASTALPPEFHYAVTVQTPPTPNSTIDKVLRFVALVKTSHYDELTGAHESALFADYMNKENSVLMYDALNEQYASELAKTANLTVSLKYEKERNELLVNENQNLREEFQNVTKIVNNVTKTLENLQNSHSTCKDYLGAYVKKFNAEHSKTKWMKKEQGNFKRIIGYYERKNEKLQKNSDSAFWKCVFWAIGTFFVTLSCGAVFHKKRQDSLLGLCSATITDMETEIETLRKENKAMKTKCRVLDEINAMDLCGVLQSAESAMDFLRSEKRRLEKQVLVETRLIDNITADLEKTNEMFRSFADRCEELVRNMLSAMDEALEKAKTSEKVTVALLAQVEALKTRVRSEYV